MQKTAGRKMDMRNISSPFRLLVDKARLKIFQTEKKIRYLRHVSIRSDHN